MRCWESEMSYEVVGRKRSCLDKNAKKRRNSHREYLSIWLKYFRWVKTINTSSDCIFRVHWQMIGNKATGLKHFISGSTALRVHFKRTVKGSQKRTVLESSLDRSTVRGKVPVKSKLGVLCRFHSSTSRSHNRVIHKVHTIYSDGQTLRTFFFFFSKILILQLEPPQLSLFNQKFIT